MDKMMTFTSGHISRSFSVAVTPFSTGMLMSNSTTSGLCCWQNSITCRPSAHSPITSRSCSMLRIRLSPSRNSLWSSATTTVITRFSRAAPFTPVMSVMASIWHLLLSESLAERERDAYGRALTRGAVDLKGALQKLHAFPHAHQAEPGLQLRPLAGIAFIHPEPHAVVLDRHPDFGVGKIQLQGYERGPRVPLDVVERFLGEPEQRHFHRPGEPPFLARRFEGSLDPGPLFEILHIFSQCRRKAQIVQGHRAQQENDFADFLEPAAELRPQIGQLRPEILNVVHFQKTFGDLRLQHEVGQRLRGAVVDFADHALALLLLGHDDLEPEQ